MWFSLAVCEIMKAIVKQRRPEPFYLICVDNSSYGMPSSHSSMSIGWIVLLAIDLPTVFVLKRPWLPRVCFNIACVLLIPVPMSRVILGDHSPTQAMAGTLVGIALGAAWWGLGLLWRDRFENGQVLLSVLTHNYAAEDKAKDEGERLSLSDAVAV